MLDMTIFDWDTTIILLWFLSQPNLCLIFWLYYYHLKKFDFWYRIPQHQHKSWRNPDLEIDSTSHNKVMRYATKYRLVYRIVIQHWRRKIHLCKLSVYCNIICLRYCIQSVKRVISLGTCFFGGWFFDHVFVIILLNILHKLGLIFH